MKRSMGFWIATWWGSGLLKGKWRIGGGTWGSLAAIPLCWILLVAIRHSNWEPVGVMIWTATVLGILTLGVISIPSTETLLGPRRNWRGQTVNHDQSEIVIDEVFGMLITTFPLVFITFHSWFLALTCAFLLFRAFDTIKIYPTKLFDRWQSEWGVMLDDGIAGIYAACLLTLVLKISNL